MTGAAATSDLSVDVGLAHKYIHATYAIYDASLGQVVRYSSAALQVPTAVPTGTFSCTGALPLYTPDSGASLSGINCVFSDYSDADQDPLVYSLGAGTTCVSGSQPITVDPLTGAVSGNMASWQSASCAVVVQAGTSYLPAAVSYPVAIAFPPPPSPTNFQAFTPLGRVVLPWNYALDPVATNFVVIRHDSSASGAIWTPTTAPLSYSVGQQLDPDNVVVCAQVGSLGCTDFTATPGKSYTYRLIADDGAQLSPAVDTPTVIARGFVAPAQVNVTTGSNNGLVSAFNAAGQGVMAWCDSGQLEATRFSPDSGWEAASLLPFPDEAAAYRDCGDTSVAIDGAGDVMLTVSFTNAPTSKGYYASYRPATANFWPKPTPIASLGEHGSGIADLSGGESGGFFFTYSVNNLGQGSGGVYALHFDPAAGSSGAWGPMVTIASDAYPEPFPLVAANASGGAAIIFTSGNGGNIGTAAVRYLGSNSWSAPVTIGEASSANSENHHSLAIDNNGDVYAAWRSFSASSGFGVITARYNASSSTWEAPVKVSADGVKSDAPYISVNSNLHKAAVAWHAAGDGLYVSIFDETQWSSPARVGNNTPDSNATGFDLVYVDDTGGVLFAGLDQAVGVSPFPFYNYFDQSSGVWIGEISLTPNNAQPASSSGFLLAPSATRINVIWTQQSSVDGTYPAWMTSTVAMPDSSGPVGIPGGMTFAGTNLIGVNLGGFSGADLTGAIISPSTTLPGNVHPIFGLCNNAACSAPTFAGIDLSSFPGISTVDLTGASVSTTTTLPNGSHPSQAGTCNNSTCSTSSSVPPWQDVTTTNGGTSKVDCGTSNTCIYQDNVAGLMVTKVVNGGSNWLTAVDSCSNSTYGGYGAGTWRLPTKEELLSLVADGIFDKASDDFISSSDMINAAFWSSAELDFQNALFVNLWNGYYSDFDKLLSLPLSLCVK